MLGTPEGTEPLIQLKVGPQCQDMEFLVDSGTVQELPWGSVSSQELQVGEPFKVPIIKGAEIEAPCKYGLGSFLLVPEAEYNLLCRDLIIELGANLEVRNKELTVQLCALTVKDEEQINPEVWYSSDAVGKLDIAPFEVTIKNPEIPVRIK